MNIAAIDIVERFYAFMWPMLRISALLLAAPVFSLSALTVKSWLLTRLAPLVSSGRLTPLMALPPSLPALA
jgi:flagellar biosynthesis protein FliR